MCDSPFLLLEKTSVLIQRVLPILREAEDRPEVLLTDLFDPQENALQALFALDTLSEQVMGPGHAVHSIYDFAATASGRYLQSLDSDTEAEHFALYWQHILLLRYDLLRHTYYIPPFNDKQHAIQTAEMMVAYAQHDVVLAEEETRQRTERLAEMQRKWLRSQEEEAFDLTRLELARHTLRARQGDLARAIRALEKANEEAATRLASRSAWEQKQTEWAERFQRWGYVPV